MPNNLSACEQYIHVSSTFADLVTAAATVPNVSPDHAMDVMEQVFAVLFIRLVTDVDKTNVVPSALGILNTIRLCAGRNLQASPNRQLACQATTLFMEGFYNMQLAPPARNYPRAVSCFKQVVKLARKLVGTPYAMPGTVQLCWARAAECFFQQGEATGFETCLRKALERLPAAICQEGIFTLACLSKQHAAKYPEFTPLETELLPAWLAASASDPTGRTLRRVGWYFCGTAYCSVTCAQRKIALGWLPCNSCANLNYWCPPSRTDHPLELEQQLAKCRPSITTTSAAQLFRYYVEQASRLCARMDAEGETLRGGYARLALRCSEVVAIQHSNPARVSEALLQMRGLTYDKNNLFREYLPSVRLVADDEISLDRIAMLEHYGDEVVDKAEAMWSTDKNCFAGCISDAEVVARVQQQLQGEARATE